MNEEKPSSWFETVFGGLWSSVGNVIWFYVKSLVFTFILGFCLGIWFIVAISQSPPKQSSSHSTQISPRQVANNVRQPRTVEYLPMRTVTRGDRPSSPIPVPNVAVNSKQPKINRSKPLVKKQKARRIAKKSNPPKAIKTVTLKLPNGSSDVLFGGF